MFRDFPEKFFETSFFGYSAVIIYGKLNPKIYFSSPPCLCILSGESTNTTKDFSLVVFFVLERTYERLPPGGSEAARG